MEEYKGGLNAFVHISLPDEVLMHIEQVRYQCEDCGRNYYVKDVASPRDNIYIEKFMPEDGHCDDCGSVNITKADDVDQFADQMTQYHERKEELLSIYNHFGTLVDVQARKGYDGYDDIKRAIQHNIKH